MQTELEELQKKLVQVIEYAEKETEKLVKVEEETNRKVCEFCSIIKTIRLAFTIINSSFTVQINFEDDANARL